MIIKLLVPESSLIKLHGVLFTCKNKHTHKLTKQLILAVMEIQRNHWIMKKNSSTVVPQNMKNHSGSKLTLPPKLAPLLLLYTKNQ